MRPIPAANPRNRFAASLVEYFDDLPGPEVELSLYEDHTKQVLAENDSPDLGFRYSINPYRGCFHGCAYCLAGDTSILMADGSTKQLADVRAGDQVVGTAAAEGGRRFVPSLVMDRWATARRAYRVRLDSGTELVASGDHRFLTPHGWRYVIAPGRNTQARLHLREKDACLGPGKSRLKARGLFKSSPRDVSSSVAGGVASVETLGTILPLFDISTETGDFVANGVVSHNCYARPTHEYLSFGAGTDFERKIVLKPNVAALLREAFEKKSWHGELIMLSGNTDCYQPLENEYRLTRGILEVCAEYRNPVHVITKSALIERDIDLLARLNAEASVGVSISIPFWNADTARKLEPFVTTPQRRMKTVARLAAAGIPVTVNIAPLILGLADRDVPSILEAAAEAGARGASLIPLRLPGAVKDVFTERLQAGFPLSAEKVLRRTREMRGGKLYDSRFGARMSGEGQMFQAVEMLFQQTCARLGLNRAEGHRHERPSTFRRPTDAHGQLRLF
ncbi:MAG: Radical domain protein [Polyangiaceae bacterium]|jgi:DNA repair photolyase|nr:Radical domain protein [Polyangiaceae bacterium]